VCGGVLKSATVSSGQALDPDVVVANAQDTPYDGLADLVVREPLGTALPRLLGIA
jgi:hypothetical protein